MWYSIKASFPLHSTRMVLQSEGPLRENRSFLGNPKPRCQSEAKYKATDRKMISYSHANEPRQKGLGLIASF